MDKPTQDQVNALLLSNQRVIMEAILAGEGSDGMQQEAADRLRSQIQQTAEMATALGE